MNTGVVRASLATLLAIALYGCASAKPVAYARAEARHVFEKNYALGVECAASVGAPIVKVRDYYELVQDAEVLSATESFTLQEDLPPFLHADVPAGTLAEVRGATTSSGKALRVAWIKEPVVWMKEPTDAALLFLLNEDGSFEGSAIDALNARMGSAYHPSPTTVRFLPVASVDASRGFVRFELIYGGATKDSINVLCRTYGREDPERPTTSENLEFPRDATTMHFKEIEISVLEASESRLRYVVLSDGSR